MRPKTLLLLLFVLWFCLPGIILAQNDKIPLTSEIGPLLERYSSVITPQKVYLHLDKNSYTAGQTIWLKAYLFDGTGHFPVDGKQNLYVELMNLNGDNVARKILLAGNGFAYGDILLGSNMPEGNYILRAYTDWMRNFDEELFFSRELYVRNPGYANMIPRADVRRNRRFNRDLQRMGEQYTVAFFPEGGNLVAGAMNRVTVKVVDRLGRGQASSGELVDNSGNTVLRFDTGVGGLGLMDFEPAAGSSYQASITVGSERVRSYDLPPVNTEGYAMRVHQTEKEIVLGLLPAVNPGSSLYSPEVVLVGHSRGVPVFSNSFSTDKGRISVSVDKSLFSSGITHFTLFTSNGRPVAERLVFIDREDQLEINTDVGMVSSAESDSADLVITVADAYGNPAAGSFSIAAVSGDRVPDFGTPNIVSYILLSADLDGNIHQILASLDTNLDINVAIDRLLLTYGWRRFKWEDVLSGNFPDINYQPEAGLRVTGRLVNPANNETISNSVVNLKAPGDDDPDTYSARSARGGVFEFNELFYEGDVEMQISSTRLSGGYPPRIEISPPDLHGFSYSPGPATRENRITDRGGDWSRPSSAPTASQADREQGQRRLFGAPDQTIYIDHEKVGFRNLMEVLEQYGTGMHFERGTVRIVGHSNLEGSIYPGFMLDGRWTSGSALLSMHPRDVERVEVFRRTSASIFGMKGGGGVILAYSRRGGGSGDFADATEFLLSGYNAPREFYSDLVPMPGLADDDDAALTIFWEPLLDVDETGRINVKVPLYPNLQRVVFTIEGAGYNGGLGYSSFAVELE